MRLEKTLRKNNHSSTTLAPGDRQHQRRILIAFFSFTLPGEGNVTVLFSLTLAVLPTPETSQPLPPLAYFPCIIISSETLRARERTSEKAQSTGCKTGIPRLNLAHRYAYLGLHSYFKTSEPTFKNGAISHKTSISSYFW